MKRTLLMGFGVLTTIMGLSVAVDTAFADGCCCCGGNPPCPNMTLASCSVKACYTPAANQNVCGDAMNANACMGNGRNIFITVANFPDGACTAPKDKSVCNQPLSPCWAATSCKFEGGKCVDDTPDELYHSVTKIVPGDC